MQWVTVKAINKDARDPESVFPGLCCSIGWCFCVRALSFRSWDMAQQSVWDGFAEKEAWRSQLSGDRETSGKEVTYIVLKFLKRVLSLHMWILVLPGWATYPTWNHRSLTGTGFTIFFREQKDLFPVGVSAHYTGGCESHLEAPDFAPCCVRGAGTPTTAVCEPDPVPLWISPSPMFWLIPVTGSQEPFHHNTVTLS